MSPPAIDIRALRVNRGLGLSEAAGQMGIDPDALRRAESGESTPHPRNGFKIATFYDLKVTDIWPLEEPAAEESAA